MNKLQELIQEFCPDGVEYRKLDDVCTINRGIRVVRNQLKASGQFPVFQNSLTPMGYYDRSNCPANTAFVIVAGAAGDVGYSKTEFWAADDCFYFSCPETFLSRYLYYVLMSQQAYLYSKVRKASIPRLARNFIEDLKIPLPPLPVQREIVRILDNFTLHTAQLQEQLTLELTARKKQYEYYRNKLLSVDMGASEVVWRTIEEVCKNITSGGTPKSGNADYYGGTIPWLRTQEIDWLDIYDTQIKITEEGLSNSSAKWIPPNCVIVAMYGATAAKVAINKIPLTTNQACCNLEVDEEQALYRYVFHWLSKEYQLLKSLGQGSQSNINAQIVRQYRIPIPPLPIQQRIVAILDRFDALCNDLTSGLPAEIEARQKQYEYYRNKLLAFKCSS